MDKQAQKQMAHPPLPPTGSTQRQSRVDKEKDDGIVATPSAPSTKQGFSVMGAVIIRNNEGKVLTGPRFKKEKAGRVAHNYHKPSRGGPASYEGRGSRPWPQGGRGASTFKLRGMRC
ncbi:hypothetical protein LWI29_024051 [Acer saccharum]|uniref:Uncharacterized protein n=1 Tax=Acer saccharum TaxID=4024 RepID=A0AA39VE63_ACESA|nr:hypothetical protein LWI29_024051 [Acer saccharum]